jgi:hypothetical protein
MPGNNILVSSLSGYVYVTPYTFTDITPSNKIVKRIWDFGDGNFLYGDKVVTHYYNYPDTFNVGLTSVDNIGNVYTGSQTVSADYIYRDAIKFSKIPSVFSSPGKPTPTPFQVSVTSAQIVPQLTFDLFADNSRSTPYQFVPPKWRFLAPTWRFLANDRTTVISSLSSPTEPLYVDGRVAGVSALAEFYFVDDLSTDRFDECPLLLTVTVQTTGFINFNDSTKLEVPSYANNKSVRTGLIWKVYNVQPTIFDVTENYFNNIYPLKWTGVKIPVLITAHGLGPVTSQFDLEKTGILFSYPETNEFGSNYPVTITLSGVPETHYEVEKQPLYFQTIDEKNNFTGGYIYTTITALSPIDTTSVLVSAALDIDPNNDADNYVWVSNPSNNILHRIFISPFTDDVIQDCKTVFAYKIDNNLIDGSILSIPVPSLSTNNTFNYGMSGFSGIYAVAIEPRSKDLIATDAELERIYKFSSEGSLLSTLELSSLDKYTPLSGAYSPSNISLDSDFNFYVSLFNAISVLKFDEYFNHVSTFIPLSTNFNSQFDSDFLLKPPAVETDRDNNVWVTYAHPLCSMLVKYSSSGNTLLELKLDDYSVPVGLAVNFDNNVWVANSFNASGSGGNLQLFTSNGILISTVENITRPGYLSIDRNNNLWFSYDIRNFGCFTTTGELSTWTLNESGDLTTPENSSNLLLEDEQIGGLATDQYNRVWILDSVTNNSYVYPARLNITSDIRRQIQLLPDSTIGYYNDIETNSFTITTTGEYYKSAQANGDWTGYKWFIKYQPALSSVNIFSQSTPFTVFDINTPPEIRKINEDFNNAGYLKSLALPETLQQNTNLFDNFLPAVVGDGENNSSFEDLGLTIYEKIANFNLNHADIDTCTIDQLLSLAKLTKTFGVFHGIDFPYDIQKYLDIASVSRSKLWGIKSPLPLTDSSTIGDRLDTNTYVLTAGNNIYLRNRFDGNNLTLVSVPLLNGQSVYPLSSIELYGFAIPLTDHYLFYEYIPKYSDEFIENIIDWNNPNTTITSELSTYENWLEDTGAVEQIFNYLLTNNLIVK